jgi:NADH pyrophosphatase NudC (nudix superfamily)
MGYAVVAVVTALMLGFGVGLLIFKRSSRWCPVCGITLECRACPTPQGRGR